mgnify:FL=1
MANQYFQKTFKPDIINGDVSNVIQSNKTDLPFSSSDVLFDWQPLDIPLGTDAIIDALVYMVGEDGGIQPGTDINLLIAKSKSGVAPVSLGSPNSTIAVGSNIPEVLIGVLKIEGDANRQGNLDLAFGTAYYFKSTGANGHVGPVPIEPEQNSLGGQATNRIYVAAIAGGAFDFSTGVLLNDASDVANDAGTSLTVDGVDPRKSFSVGDTVYIHDVDTPIGTVASLAANTITLTSNNVGAIADDDEFMNATPITVTLSFRGR